MLLCLFIALALASQGEEKYANITTLFSQGMWASRGQAAKYTRRGVEVNGRVVRYSGANDLLHNPVAYAELAQISYAWTANPLYLAMQFLSWCKTVDYWSHNDTAYHVFLSAVDIAGPNEVAHHRESWLAHDAATPSPHHRLVLFGTSRGAATTFVSVAISAPHERRRLALVVLEAPFDSVENALKYRYGEDWGKLAFDVVRRLTNYSATFLSPARAAWRFPLDVPVAFITSRADSVVHHNQTAYLMDILRVRGHPNMHHLQLESSAHTHMPLGDGEDQHRYVRFMEEMYERYCLCSPKVTFG